MNQKIVFWAWIGCCSFLVSLAPEATAQVACEAIKLQKSGSSPVRGVRVTLDGKTHVERGFFSSENAVVYFDVDAQARDRAGQLCQEIVKATRCIETAPKAQDRYYEAGDPGFGPSLWRQDSTKAAVFSADTVSSEASRLSNERLARLDGEYIKYYSDCEKTRADLAYEVLKTYREEWSRKSAYNGFEIYEPVDIYEKF